MPKVLPKLKAYRDNVSSTDVTIDMNDILGTGTFRITYRGTYTNGRKVNQLAACKCFHPIYDIMYGTEFYMYDAKVVQKAIIMAQLWNQFCSPQDSITFNKGNIVEKDGIKYHFEPIIEPYYKYTSNTGWILPKTIKNRNIIECLEAFCHYTYHISDRNMMICDLQGKYKLQKFTFTKSHYRLTDPAICSARRLYGPTDMGQKGIVSFFANHKCNKYCIRYGQGKWKRPRVTQCYFVSTAATTTIPGTTTTTTTTITVGHTTMMPIANTPLLQVKNPTKFDMYSNPI